MGIPPTTTKKKKLRTSRPSVFFIQHKYFGLLCVLYARSNKLL